MTASFLASSVPEAVLSIDGRPIKIGKQPALCLGKIQGDGFGLTTGGQKPPDIVQVSTWLVLRWKLL